jgi:hypothetical protein
MRASPSGQRTPYLTATPVPTMASPHTMSSPVSVASNDTCSLTATDTMRSHAHACRGAGAGWMIVRSGFDSCHAGRHEYTQSHQHEF